MRITVEDFLQRTKLYITSARYSRNGLGFWKKCFPVFDELKIKERKEWGTTSSPSPGSFPSHLLLVVHQRLQVMNDCRFEVTHSLFLKSGHLFANVLRHTLKFFLTLVYFLFPLQRDRTSWDFEIETGGRPGVGEYLSDFLFSHWNFVHLSSHFQFGLCFPLLSQHGFRFFPILEHLHPFMEHFLHGITNQCGHALAMTLKWPWTDLHRGNEANVVFDELRQDKKVRVRLVHVELLHFFFDLSQLGERTWEWRMLLSCAQHGHALGKAARVQRQLCNAHRA